MLFEFTIVTQAVRTSSEQSTVLQEVEIEIAAIFEHATRESESDTSSSILVGPAIYYKLRFLSLNSVVCARARHEDLFLVASDADSGQMLVRGEILLVHVLLV